MDPFTFGITFVGVSGGVFMILHALEQSGLSINKDMINLMMETSKFGAILWLLKELSKVFF
ncbi:hypothetical protein [Cytobacillus praedii]|uniref:hypothetical protein n=1 Tax=Cytobacillus praedii TaxID=1742358 RepID=UPI002E1E8FB1|nr:hypothetical protein [Cytobacillus praedii]